MKTDDLLSKRITSIALLLLALSAFIFSLSTITPANASPNTVMGSVERIPAGISGGKVYWIEIHNGWEYILYQ